MKGANRQWVEIRKERRGCGGGIEKSERREAESVG